MGQTTLHDLFSKGFPKRASLRFRSGEAFDETTVDAARARVLELAAALVSYGLDSGFRVAIYCGDGIEGWLAESAVMVSGGIAVPLQGNVTEERLAIALRESRARFVVVSDHERLRQMLFVRPDLPDVDLVLLFHAREGEERPAAATLVEAARARGAAALARDPDFLGRALRGVGPASPACLLLGTGRHPRDVLLTQDNVLGAARALVGVLQLTAADSVLIAQEDDRGLRRVAALAALTCGASLAFGSGNRLAEDLEAVVPTVAFVDRASLAAYQETLAASVDAKSFAVRPVFRWALEQGRKRSSAALAGGRIASEGTWMHRLADRVALRSLRGRGGSRLRFFVSAGPALPVERTSFLFAAGLPVLEGYASVEASGLLAVNTPASLRLGTVGSPVPGVEVRIGDGGRIELRGPLAAGSREDGGWLATSHFGRLEGRGYLVVSESREP